MPNLSLKYDTNDNNNIFKYKSSPNGWLSTYSESDEIGFIVFFFRLEFKIKINIVKQRKNGDHCGSFGGNST